MDSGTERTNRERPGARRRGSAGDLTRRRLLRWGGVAAVVSLAGCTADVGDELPPNEKWPISDLTPSLPVRERTDVLEERIGELSDADLGDPDAFAAAIDDTALEVESVERDRDVLSLEYGHPDRPAEGILSDIGLIAGGYAALVEADYDSVALEVTILDPAPESFGAADVETPWAERFNAGALSAAEYGELVATTIETRREPPGVEVTPGE